MSGFKVWETIGGSWHRLPANTICFLRFVRRQEQREARKHRRKKLYGFKYRMTWRDILGAFGAMALIAFAYLALPNRYRIKPDWEQAAACVMTASVMIVAASGLWRNFAFWMCPASVGNGESVRPLR
jgi:hypothetical protein